MTTNKSMDILKEAILLERRGQSFYRKIADQSGNAEVKAFFNIMADEEARHIEILEKQFTAYTRNQNFLPLSSDDKEAQPAAQLILNDTLKRQIASADFEAAAISAAMLMEEKAAALYAQRAKSTQDPTEEALYLWLADWEQEHLSYLARLDKEIKETIWNDRQFWPF